MLTDLNTVLHLRMRSAVYHPPLPLPTLNLEEPK